MKVTKSKKRHIPSFYSLSQPQLCKLILLLITATFSDSSPPFYTLIIYRFSLQLYIGSHCKFNASNTLIIRFEQSVYTSMFSYNSTKENTLFDTLSLLCPAPNSRISIGDKPFLYIVNCQNFRFSCQFRNFSCRFQYFLFTL